jgi:uncharacterized repeat protein (TIGR03847 family)
MSREASFEFETPDHFTVGTVGPPGQRVFYLQTRDGGSLITLKVEKEQMRALADYLSRLLTRLPSEQEDRPRDLVLIEPIDAQWSVGSIGVGYDREHDRIVVEAHELVEEDSGEEPAVGRVRVTRAQAAAFVERVQDLVTAGRPICPVCSGPMDPTGHICPRTNGHIVH